MRIGIIGTGKVSTLAIVRACSMTQCATVVAVASRSIAKAIDFIERNHLTAKAVMADELVSCRNVDLVYVGVPTVAHAEVTSAARSAGKSVLVEKPAFHPTSLSDSWDACETVVSPFLYEGLMWREHPWQSLVRKAIVDRRFGQLKSFNLILHFNIRHLQHPNDTVLTDIGPYVVQLLELLAGTTRITALRAGDGLIHEVIGLSFEAIKGQVSISHRKAFRAGLQLEFDTAVVTFPALLRPMIGLVMMPYIIQKRDGQEEIFFFPAANFYAAQLDHVNDLITNGAKGLEKGIFWRHTVLAAWHQCASTGGTRWTIDS